jgi:putative ubiquitin-RnfH superfamily antitoxin RatB of RatAB toxin-antitoxin module
VKVSVAIAWPHRQEVVSLDLEGEPTVADAVAAASAAACLAQADLAACGFGLWGREVAAGTKLREGDRVELLRPLQADPKDARRKRVAAGRGGPG